MTGVADRVLAGAAAGFAATGPMTVLMEALHALLPPRERDPLPPRQITTRVAEAAGVADDMSEDEKEAAAITAHFAFGTTTGAVYGLLAPRLPRSSPVLSGVGYGLAVWAASYLGLLPAVGLYRSPAREPARRHGLMIAAHVVWGAVAGSTFDQLADGSE
jgi:uncharacterized membrane protein YagU involved in acid resistance